MGPPSAVCRKASADSEPCFPGVSSERVTQACPTQLELFTVLGFFLSTVWMVIVAEEVRISCSPRHLERCGGGDNFVPFPATGFLQGLPSDRGPEIECRPQILLRSGRAV